MAEATDRLETETKRNRFFTLAVDMLAIAGYGRHGVLHEAHFFELAGDLPVIVEFVVSDAEAARLIELVDAEGASLFYVKIPVEFGVTRDGG